MDFDHEAASFCAFRRAAERPQARIEKRPALRSKQGMWTLFGEAGQILKRGHELSGVLFPLERKGYLRAVFLSSIGLIALVQAGFWLYTRGAALDAHRSRDGHGAARLPQIRRSRTFSFRIPQDDGLPSSPQKPKPRPAQLQKSSAWPRRT